MPGHIPLYQGNCNTRFRFDRGNTNRAPMLALLGGADDGTPADACVAYYTELNAAGANIQWKVYPGAFHNFDGSTQKTYLSQGVTALTVAGRAGDGAYRARLYVADAACSAASSASGVAGVGAAAQPEPPAKPKPRPPSHYL